MSKKPFTKEEFEDLIDEGVGEKIRELIDSGELAKGPGPIPSGIVTVSGGTLTDESIKRMEEFMEEAAGNPDYGKMLILKAESDDIYGTEETINWIPLNEGKPPPIVQLSDDGTTGTIISGTLEEVRAILKKFGSIKIPWDHLEEAKNERH